MFCENCGAMNGETFAQHNQRQGIAHSFSNDTHVFEVKYIGKRWLCEICSFWHLLNKQYDPETGKAAAMLTPVYEPWGSATLMVCSTVEFALLNEARPRPVALVLAMIRRISGKTGLPMGQVVTILEKEVQSNG